VSTEIRFDPAAAEDTENQLRSTAEDIQGHGDTLGAGTSGAVGRGSLGAVAENLVKKGIDVVVHGVTGVFAKLHTDTADGIKLVREQMLKDEDKSSQASKDLEASLGNAFDRGGGTLAAHVGGPLHGPPLVVTHPSPQPPHARVPDKFFGGDGSIIEHEDGSVTYVTGPGHALTSTGKPTNVPVGTAITYDKNGEPDFSAHLHPDVPSVTFPNGFNNPPSRTKDFAASNAKAIEQLAGTGKQWPLRATDTTSPPGYTWHHGNDGTTMYLVDRDVHGFFKHFGGISLVGKRGASSVATGIGKKRKL
jgi:hypothetical protein